MNSKIMEKKKKTGIPTNNIEIRAGPES